QCSAQSIGVRRGAIHAYLALHQGVKHGARGTAGPTLEPGPGYAGKIQAGVDGVIARELHAAVAADIGTREVGAEVELDGAAARFRGGGEIAHRLLIHGESLGGEVRV